jgi:phosphatidylglycerol:prolipoprotein diacylglycerol transferase
MSPATAVGARSRTCHGAWRINAIVSWADPNTGIPYAPGVRVIRRRSTSFSWELLFRDPRSLRKKNLAPGTLAWLYLILTGMARFVVEFWRINPAIGFGFSEAQWFSLILMMLGLFLLLSPPVRVQTQ